MPIQHCDQIKKPANQSDICDARNSRLDSLCLSQRLVINRDRFDVPSSQQKSLALDKWRKSPSFASIARFVSSSRHSLLVVDAQSFVCSRKTDNSCTAHRSTSSTLNSKNSLLPLCNKAMNDSNLTTRTDELRKSSGDLPLLTSASPQLKRTAFFFNQSNSIFS